MTNAEREKAWRQNNKEHLATYMRQWHRDHPTWNTDRNRKMRVEVIEHYGGKCACCGEVIFEFLQLDHIEGNGRKHRDLVGRSMAAMHRWLKKNNWPEGFQILCSNCNTSLGYYGYCPHRPDIRRETYAEQKRRANGAGH